MRRKKSKKLPDKFLCKNQKREIEMMECVDAYVEANAFNQQSSPCYKCQQGQYIRTLFAKE
jgi:hypothetical protein